MSKPFIQRIKSLSILLVCVAVISACGGSSGDAAAAGGSNGTGTSTGSTPGSGAVECSSSQTGASRLVCLALAFKSTLSASDQTSVQYALTKTNAVRWSNLPASMSSRNGLKIGNLSATSMAALQSLLQAALGAQGEASRVSFLLADDVLGTVQSNGYGSANYYIAFIGTPSADTPWILQFTGHHYTSHITVNGATLSPTPMFIAIEPQTFTVGSTAYEPMGPHRLALYDLLNSLDATQQLSAKLSGTYTDLVVTPGRDGQFPSARAGVPVSSLSTAQQAKLKTAIAAWVKSVDSDIADTLLAEYTSASALAETYIGWSGSASSTPSLNSYVRIDGPKVWIEFSAQRGIIYPNQIHFHSIWRDKTRDYGGLFSF